MEIILIKSYTEKPWRNQSTYQMIESSLKEKWAVHSIETKKPFTLINFIKKIQQEQQKNIFVFNIAEYLDEKNKVGFLPLLLDELAVLHLGSSAKSIEKGLNKATTKALLIKNGIPTPRYFEVNNQRSDHKLKNIGFPVIVKPVSEGGHIGIGEESIVYEKDGLNKMINRVLEKHHQPALVEEFITGPEMREFSVGIIDGETRLFTPIEIDYKAMKMEKDILSYQAAQKDLEKTKLVHEENIRDKIIDLAARTFDVLAAKDYSRVDIRMDETDCYVLEINIMPGLGPNSFLPQAAKDIHGLDYNHFIHKVVENSILRQNH